MEDTRRLEPAHGPVSRQLMVAGLAFGLIMAWFGVTVLYPAAGRQTGGFGAYYTSSRLLINGQISAAIYDAAYFRPLVEADSGGATGDIYNANPPTTSLMLAPLAFLSSAEARLIWSWLNLLLLLGGLGGLVWAFAGRPDLLTYLAVGATGLLFQPVIENFRYGQAYVLLFLLLSLAAVAFQRDRPSAGGIALALMLILKTAGWPLLLLLAWRRQWRYLAWTFGAAGLIILLALPWLPLAMWQSYRQLLPQVIGSPLVCVTPYQTTRSFLCHLFAPQIDWSQAPVLALPWTATAVFTLLALVTLAINWRLAARDPLAAFMSFVAWSILFAPLGEQHHHVVMLVPIVWLLLLWRDGRLDSRLVRAGLILVLVFYIVPFPVHWPQWQTDRLALLAYPRLYGAWLTLLAIYGASLSTGH